MSATCEICGREFKTTQGLRGHKTFVHRVAGSGGKSATPLTEEQEPNRLEDRREKPEKAADLGRSPLLDRYSATEAAMAEQLEYLTRQVDEQASRLEKVSAHASRLSEQFQLTKAIGSSISADHAKLKDAHDRQKSAVSNDIGTLGQRQDDLERRLEETENWQYSRVTDIDNALALANGFVQTTTALHHKSDDLESRIASLEQRIIRQPTGKMVEVRLKDGQERTFKQYSSPDGLTNPFQHAFDLAYGRRWIDLAEPED